ncbi:MAG: hypothetical protein IPG86_18610 [Chitinophagaceae bacterium]|nr:hypothetical protein [Chitinophagaceae bacterium]
MQWEQVIGKYKGQVITQSILGDLLKDYKWPHNKVRDLENRGLLTGVKRGLYITGPLIKVAGPSSYLLANHIYGPSYVSLEAALSYWGMIPEKVTVIASMTTGLTKTFRTTAGRFSYIKVKLPYYSFGIRKVELSGTECVLMAGPEKAICDKIISSAGLLLRSVNQTLDLLIEDLRIERSVLRELDKAMIKTWVLQAPKKSSIKMLVKALETI